MNLRIKVPFFITWLFFLNLILQVSSKKQGTLIITIKVNKKGGLSMNHNASAQSLITRVEMFIQQENWSSARTYVEQVLDEEPENGYVYFLKMLVERKAKSDGELIKAGRSVAADQNYPQIPCATSVTIPMLKCTQIKRKQTQRQKEIQNHKGGKHHEENYRSYHRSSYYFRNSNHRNSARIRIKRILPHHRRYIPFSSDRSGHFLHRDRPPWNIHKRTC